MSITDELREAAAELEVRHTNNDHDFTDLFYPHPSRREFLAIADRIDAEHERELRETGEDIVQDVRHEWVRLPLDADNVPICVGDVLDGYGKTIEVVEMRHGRSGWVLISRDGNGYADTFAFAHHHEPTVEDVLRDMLDSLDLDPTSHVDTGAVVAEYAAKLRLAGDGE